jgi:CIC family chloride channel protein
MFIGATLGGCIGGAVAHVVPNLGVGPPVFAYAGMAAMVGGTTGAAITATIMVFEMTRDYTAILPVILSVVVAVAIRQWLSPPTIYTLKLLRRGHVVPQGLQAWRGELRSRDVMSSQFVVMTETQVGDTDTVHSLLGRNHVVVVTDSAGEILGVIDARSDVADERPASRAWILVQPDEYLHAVLRRLQEGDARIAVVTDRSPAGKRLAVLGIISGAEILQLACEQATLIG